jgi:DNA-binding PadR family transcriptional regulator
MVMYLIQDGLLVDTGQTSGVILSGMPSQKLYQLTPSGKEFVNKWISAQEIE